MEILGAYAGASVAGICCWGEGFRWERVTGICTIVIAICAFVSAWVAIIAVRVQDKRARLTADAQDKRARFTTELDAILQLDRLWYSKRLRKARALAAGQILDTKKPTKVIEEILDFFEAVGLLVRKKAITVELAWSFFYYWLDGYATVARDYINDYQRKNPTVYEDFDWLCDQVRSFEQRRLKCTAAELNLTPEEKDEFLRDEAKR